MRRSNATASRSLRLLEQAAEVVVGDVAAIDNRCSIDSECDGDDFSDFFAGRAFALGLFQVAFEAALATGGERGRDRDELLRLQVELRLAVGRLLKVHV